jgi:hypothetical protein
LTYHSWKPDADKWPTIAVILGTAALLAKSTGSYLGLQYIGDAARYLSPTPANIGVRHDIRSAAIDLLEGLHEDPLRRYHRIVLVGHSLGSVIGYDALTHFWQRRHHPDASQLHPAARPAHDRLQRPWSAEEGRELQRAVWWEQHAIGVSWKITDFITLGSPLAHASFLLSAGPRDFDQRKGQRDPCRAQEGAGTRQLVVRGRCGSSALVYFGVSFNSLLVGGVFALIDAVPLSVRT